MTEKYHKNIKANREKIEWGMGRVEFLTIIKYIPNLLARGYPRTVIYRELKQKHKLTLSQSCFYRHLKTYEKELRAKRSVLQQSTTPNDKNNPPPLTAPQDEEKPLTQEQRDAAKEKIFGSKTLTRPRFDPTVDRRKMPDNWSRKE